MTYYIKSGNQYDVTSEQNLDIHKLLPVGTYTIQQRPMGGPLFFQAVDDLENKGKIYGDHHKNAERIIATYKSRPRNTGVLLAGEKDSGKTLLARMISEECAKVAMPTIIITRPWTGDAFNGLINGVTQDCVILFDEFEKVYSAEDQEEMLTLLDGLSSSKKLFIFTVNNKWKMDEHMHNRPGRIFYAIDYEGLSIEFIREYCEDNLLNKSYIDKVCTVSTMFAKFNFDMLKALVEEMNRYNESPDESLRILNAKPSGSRGDHIKYSVEFKDKEHPELVLMENEDKFTGNALTAAFNVCFYPNAAAKARYDNDADDDDDNVNTKYISFNAATHLKTINDKGEYIFDDGKGRIAILRRIVTQQQNYYDYIA